MIKKLHLYIVTSILKWDMYRIKKVKHGAKTRFAVQKRVWFKFWQTTKDDRVINIGVVDNRKFFKFIHDAQKEYNTLLKRVA